MIDGTTTIAGIEIPSTDLLFLSVVAVHVLLGIVAVVSGAVTMLSAKAPGRHPRSEPFITGPLSRLRLRNSAKHHAVG